MEPEGNKNIPPQNQNDNKDIAPLHTYKSDVASFIKTEGKTLADIAIAENARSANALRDEAAKPILTKRNIKIALVAIVLFSASAGIVWTLFSANPKNSSPTSNPNATARIFVSGIKERDISLGKTSGTSAAAAIVSVLKESAPFLSLNILALDANGNEEPVNIQTFFEKLSIYPPADLIRSLSGKFAIGSIAGTARFIVLKNNYYPSAFAGMLKWEEAMNNDLRELLGLPVANASHLVTETLGTTTTLARVNQSGFKDAVVGSRDSRILKDGGGAVIMLYLFPDNETILIASNENAAKIAADKLLHSAQTK